MIKKIFVPVRGDGKGENVLRHAAVIAKRFGAQIEATHCRPNLEDLMPFGQYVPGFMRDDLKQQAAALADEEEKKLRSQFDAFVSTLGLKIAEGPLADEPSIRWVEAQGRIIDVMKERARLCDLIAVARPDRDRNVGTNTLKAALFSSGRPVLMAPPAETAPQSLCERLAFAWNGSFEATRALVAAMPMMRSASSLTLLAIGVGEAHGAKAEELQSYLALHGVAASVRRAPEGDDVGETLLAEAAAAGADALVMGAYGQSHERETIFGGNTQTVVDQAKMPVVFVH